MPRTPRPEAAKAFAQKVMDQYKWEGEPRRILDTQYNDLGWQIRDDESLMVVSDWFRGLLVVYDDEPYVVVSTGNHEGRFVDA